MSSFGGCFLGFGHAFLVSYANFISFCQTGVVAGVGLAIILSAWFGPIANLFTKDMQVVEIAKSGTLVSRIFSILFFVVVKTQCYFIDFNYVYPVCVRQSTNQCTGFYF